MRTCPKCHYAREERAGIHEFDGKLPRDEAEWRAVKENPCECDWEMKEKGGVNVEL